MISFIQYSINKIFGISLMLVLGCFLKGTCQKASLVIPVGHANYVSDATFPADDQDGQKLVDVIKRFNYARDEVPKLAESINGIQTPMLGFPKDVATIDIGIFNDAVDIPTANKKPILVGCNLWNSETLLDDLELVPKLEQAFRKESAKGKNADFLFFDVNKYPKAYQLTGLYEQSAGQIKLRAKLTQAGKPPVDLELPETLDKDKLVRHLIRAIKKAIK